jgi:hypothetical protein
MGVAVDYKLSMPFIGQMMERRLYRGGEMIDDEWNYSMLLFWGEERKGQHPFQKGKGACEAPLGSHAEGRLENVEAWRWPIAGVGQRLDWSEVEDN